MLYGSDDKLVFLFVFREKSCEIIDLRQFLFDDNLWGLNLFVKFELFADKIFPLLRERLALFG